MRAAHNTSPPSPRPSRNADRPSFSAPPEIPRRNGTEGNNNRNRYICNGLVPDHRPERQTSFWLYMLNMYAAAATKRCRQPMNISWLLNVGGLKWVEIVSFFCVCCWPGGAGADNRLCVFYLTHTNNKPEMCICSELRTQMGFNPFVFHGQILFRRIRGPNVISVDGKSTGPSHIKQRTQSSGHVFTLCVCALFLHITTNNSLAILRS